MARKYFPIVAGTVYFLIGLLGWIFRDGFGNIPVYLLIVNIILGLWGLFIGFASKPKSSPPPPGISEPE